LTKSPLSESKFRYGFTAWWLVWAGLHAILIIDFGYPSRIAVVDSLVTNLQLLGACWLVSNLLRFYLPQKERYWHMLILCGGLSGLVVLFSKWILETAFNDMPGYMSFLSNTWTVRFGIFFLLIGCMILLCALWYTIEEEKDNQRRSSDAERISRDAELYKLRQQLQPHFLFNSLNSISALLGSQPDQARKMIHQLSEFLRGNLKKEEQKSVPLSEELQYLELYLEIEKVRFGHRLSTKFEIAEQSQGMKLPPMLLQPIVENAIKFGLYDTTESITIGIAARSHDHFLEITVENPFDPETSFPSRGTGFGLSSIKRRLYLLFGRSDLLEAKAAGQLFTTTVKIPQTT
jgi:hypothetical protein